MTDVIGGQVPMMFVASPPALPHIKAGRLRALGTSSAKGLSVLPEVPPIAATYPGFDHTDWYGIVAPAGTPAAVIARVNKGINQAMAMPDVRERIQATGAQPVAGTPQEFDARLHTELAKWAKVFRKS
jgi:tripartite-type tricarboxylate transporter receptor subunit TctC